MLCRSLLEKANEAQHNKWPKSETRKKLKSCKSTILRFKPAHYKKVAIVYKNGWIYYGDLVS